MGRTEACKAAQKKYYQKKMETNPEFIRDITRRGVMKHYYKNNPIEEQTLLSVRKLFVRSNLNDPYYRRAKPKEEERLSED